MGNKTDGNARKKGDFQGRWQTRRILNSSHPMDTTKGYR